MRVFDRKPQSLLNPKQQIHWNCSYHSGERITNFCLSQQCLLPLCPQCVKTHLQQHSKMNLHGNFQVIETVVNNVKTDLNTKVYRTQKLKSLIECMAKNRGHELQQIVNSLKKFKSQIITTINQHFKSLQDQIKESFNSGQQKYLQEVQKNQILSKSLLESTKKALESMGGNNCMQAVVISYTDLKKKQSLLDQSCKNIQQLSLSRNTVNINRSLINQILQQINSSIGVTTVDLPEFQLIHNLASNNNPQDNNDETKSISLKGQGIRHSLVDLKFHNQDSYVSEKFEGKLQEGLFERLSKTTKKLQDDLETLRRADSENRSLLYN